MSQRRQVERPPSSQSRRPQHRAGEDVAHDDRVVARSARRGPTAQRDRTTAPQADPAPPTGEEGKRAQPHPGTVHQRAGRRRRRPLALVDRATMGATAGRVGSDARQQAAAPRERPADESAHGVTTPLGMPVVPPVYSIMMSSSPRSMRGAGSARRARPRSARRGGRRRRRRPSSTRRAAAARRPAARPGRRGHRGWRWYTRASASPLVSR